MKRRTNPPRPFERLWMLSVDLAASERRPTGLAYWEGSQLRLETVKTDAQIKRVMEDHDIIGIDAPLTMPDEGHLRECDRRLIQRRIRFFPVTWKPMRALHRRAMKLMNGIDARFWEIYPGAAYDIVGLDRKAPQQLARFLEHWAPHIKNQHEADALMGLFTLYLWKKELAEVLTGRDGTILIPKPLLSFPRLRPMYYEGKLNRFVIMARDKRGQQYTVYNRNTGEVPVEKGDLIWVEEYAGKHPFIWRATVNAWVDPYYDPWMARLIAQSNGRKVGPGKKYEGGVSDLTYGQKHIEIKGVNFGDLIVEFPHPCSQRAVRQLKSGHLAEIWFIAHQRALAVALNPACKRLEEALEAAVRKGLSIHAYSTRFIRPFWVWEMEVPFLF